LDNVLLRVGTTAARNPKASAPQHKAGEVRRRSNAFREQPLIAVRIRLCGSHRANSCTAMPCAATNLHKDIRRTKYFSAICLRNGNISQGSRYLLPQATESPSRFRRAKGARLKVPRRDLQMLSLDSHVHEKQRYPGLSGP